MVAGVAAGIVFAIDKLAGVCQKMRSMPMPRIGLALVGVCFLLTGVASVAAPLSSATVTEMKNDVRFKATTTEERSAKLQDTIAGADVLRTGERSLAEIEFNDKTLTRLGSKSVFSFEPANREFRVDKGLALICLPKGTGGAVLSFCDLLNLRPRWQRLLAPGNQSRLQQRVKQDRQDL